MCENRPFIEVNGSIYDAESYEQSYGFESLDEIGREAFVNHIHLFDHNREQQADQIIQAWRSGMTRGWPDRVFRIYRHSTDNEIIVRFHAVRTGIANWYDGDDGKVITVGVHSERDR